MKNPSVVEDYVKTIYSHTEWQQVPITSSELAAKLGLAASSVTEMVKKLGVAGLVQHEPYGAIRLTGAGRDLALRMLRRHRLIETWLVANFGYAWDEVHDEAEVLEHAVSDRLLEAIAEQLGHPVRDPHGDPIPALDGTVVQPDALLLSQVSAGSSGRIARINDRDPALLRRFLADDITVDTDVSVVGISTAGSVSLRVGDRTFQLDAVEADSVWLTIAH